MHLDNENMFNPNLANFDDIHHHGMHHHFHDGGYANIPHEPMMDCCGPCETKVMPEVICDPRYYQQNYYENVIVPYIHPSHTVHWKHTHVTNAHYFPHTESVKCTESCEDVNCGCVPPHHMHHPHHPHHMHHHHGKF
ncbi:hypothetical protein JOD45_002201 [Scopulibacillus daqui]|uniref:Spore coat protein D n=1 Tax=Scopulibacillus daqui TaxID=1469162 RepID=A0ABS2Q0Y8_9BACL|nr:CotD family spore coat protein [Scopulibacillus daqui]MBM7645976.1 hypothetical protein [Scopulibacillus daqui]